MGEGHFGAERQCGGPALRINERLKWAGHVQNLKDSSTALFGTLRRGGLAAEGADVEGDVLGQLLIDRPLAARIGDRQIGRG